MDSLALFSTVLFSLLLAINSAMRTAKVAARKGYLPKLGATVGFAGGFGVGLLSGLGINAAITDSPGLVGLGAYLVGLAALNVFWHYVPDRTGGHNALPAGEELRRNIEARHIQGTIMRALFIVSIGIALVALATLIWTIVNRTVGLTAVDYDIRPEALTLSTYETGAYYDDIPQDAIPGLLAGNVRPVRLQELVLTEVGGAKLSDLAATDYAQPLADFLEEGTYPAELAGTPLNALTPEQLTGLLTGALDTDALRALAYTEAGRALQEMTGYEIAAILADNLSAERLRELILADVLAEPERELAGDELVWQVVQIDRFPDEIAYKPFNQITQPEAAALLVNNLDRPTAEQIVLDEAGTRILKEVRPLFRVQRPLDDLNEEELATALANNLSAERLQTLLLDLAKVSEADRPIAMTEAVGLVLQDERFPDALSFMQFDQLNASQAADILMQNVSAGSLRDTVAEEIGADTYPVGRPLNTLEADELAGILVEESREARLRVLVLEMSGLTREEWSIASNNPVSSVLDGMEFDTAIAQTPVNELTPQQAADLLARNLSIEDFRDLLFVEARNRLVTRLPESDLAVLLVENVSIEELHNLIANEVLLAGNADMPDFQLEPVLSAEQAADVLARNLTRERLEAVVLEEAAPTILAGLSDEELTAVLANNVLKETFIGLVMTNIVEAERDTWRQLTPLPIWQVLKADAYDDEVGLLPFAELSANQAADILRRDLERPALEDLVYAEVQTPALNELSERQLGAIIAVNVRGALLRRYVLEFVAGASESEFAALTGQPVEAVLRGKNYPEALANEPLNSLSELQSADLLARNLSRADLEETVYDDIAQPQVIQSWTLWESLTARDDIDATQAEDFPQAVIQWRSWLSWDFISSPMDTRRADLTGIRPAIMGSLMIIGIVVLFAFPIGVGAAIYLEEYAGKNALNQIIQTNINNLAGVPSIIYGILGLAIFVRALEGMTSGQTFGAETPNGRTILSAGMTLGLLILPVIIINAQEAIRAVPSSLRQASYGLGATQWQTIWNHVLPYAMPGILTGTILAVSRAIGETAPLILVGGATFLTQDPEGPFSIFTALPLLIYRWTTLPQPEFRNAAAAAIVVLLVVLLTLNSLAVILRNRFSRRLS